MATATEKTEMVTETIQVDVEKVTGVVLELTTEEALVVAALVGSTSGPTDSPFRRATNSIWAALNPVLGESRSPGGYRSMVNSRDYQQVSAMLAVHPKVRDL